MPTTEKRTVEKVDLRKRHRRLYAPSAATVDVVDVPDLLFTMIDGEIEPGVGPSKSEEFERSMAALYGVGYGLKFMSKLAERDPIDFTVMAAEGLWSFQPGTLTPVDGAPMRYTLLMPQPDHITQDMFRAAVSEAGAKHPNPAMSRLRLERWREGLSIQIMHIGPYSDEPRTLSLLETFAAEHGYRVHGRHHEIYLGDPRRAKPERLKTILRLPVSNTL